MLDDETLDAVLVVTGYGQDGRVQHAALAADCLRRGVAAWVEKPPVNDLDDVAMVREAIAARGATFAVGFKKAFTPATRKLASLIAEPEFGTLRTIELRYAQTIPTVAKMASAEPGRWRMSFLDHLCHPASLLRAIGGPTRALRYERTANGTGFVTFHLASGASRRSTCSLAPPAHARGADRGERRRGKRRRRERDAVLGAGTRSTRRSARRERPPLRARPRLHRRAGRRDRGVGAGWSLGQLYNKGIFLLGYYGELAHFFAPSRRDARSRSAASTTRRKGSGSSMRSLARWRARRALALIRAGTVRRGRLAGSGPKRATVAAARAARSVPAATCMPATAAAIACHADASAIPRVTSSAGRSLRSTTPICAASTDVTSARPTRARSGPCRGRQPVEGRAPARAVARPIEDRGSLTAPRVRAREARAKRLGGKKPSQITRADATPNAAFSAPMAGGITRPWSRRDTKERLVIATTRTPETPHWKRRCTTTTSARPIFAAGGTFARCERLEGRPPVDGDDGEEARPEGLARALGRRHDHSHARRDHEERDGPEKVASNRPAAGRSSQCRFHSRSRRRTWP